VAGLTVLDASVLIAHFSEGDAHHARAADLLEKLVADDLAASVITLGEALVTPTRRGRLQTARSGLAALAVAGIPVNEDAPSRLAALRADTGMRLPDCCVLLAAQDARAGAIATFDDRLARAARDLGYDTPAG